MSLPVPKIITGIPAGTKVVPRADFKPTEFDQAITTKGYRMYWSRAGLCPCLNNDQTEQPDPTCPLCHGDGYYYFMPDAAVQGGATKDEFGNPIFISPDGKGVLIYVLMTSMTQDVQIFEKFGEWVFGMSRATTQAPNKLGYRDRLIAVEAEMTWAQIIEYAGGTTIPVVGRKTKAGLRYPFLVVDQLRSTGTVFREGDDFILTTQGQVQWQVGKAPPTGTRLSIHGTIHPQWIVMDHVHAYRDSFLEGGGGLLERQKRVKLPVQAVVKLDFLITD